MTDHGQELVPVHTSHSCDYGVCLQRILVLSVIFQLHINMPTEFIPATYHKPQSYNL